MPQNELTAKGVHSLRISAMALRKDKIDIDLNDQWIEGVSERIERTHRRPSLRSAVINLARAQRHRRSSGCASLTASAPGLFLCGSPRAHGER